MSVELATLIVRRDLDADIGYRECLVSVDGYQIANLKKGQSIERKIAPGEHKLLVSNRVKKKELSFSMDLEQKVVFRAGNVGGGCYRFLAEMFGAGVPNVQLERADH